MARKKNENKEPQTKKVEQVNAVAPVVEQEQVENKQSEEKSKIQEDQKQPTGSRTDTKSVYELEDAVIGSILKYRSGFADVYKILGFNYHFKGFLQSLIYIAASELRKMNINIEPSTVMSQLKSNHKTDVTLEYLNQFANNAPSIEKAIEFAGLLKKE